MMSPTVVLRDGELELGLGSGGSNRIRSAILQTIVRLIADGMEAAEAVEAPRVHFEAGAVQAEPGIDPQALARLEARGYTVVRWAERNLFFGGVHAVSATPRPGSCAAAATRGGAGRSRRLGLDATPRPSRGGVASLRDERSRAMAKALLIIDFQNDFTSGGRSRFRAATRSPSR